MPELADVIHEEWCGSINHGVCARYKPGSGHVQYYQEAADKIMAKLEPEIGGANVILACKVIIEELV